MGCKISSYRVGGGMTSSTISVNFNDTADKTVFTATERCILKLSANVSVSGGSAAFKLNNTNIGTYKCYNNYYAAFENVNKSLANILTPLYYGGSNASNVYPTALILYLEKGDTVYANASSTFTLTLYSAVFTF